MHSGSPGSYAFDWLAAAWSRRKWMAAVIFALAAAATVTVVVSLPDVYRATATVLVEQAGADTAAPGELEMRLQVISQEILSRSRLQALIGGFNLYPGLREGAFGEAAVGQMRRDIRTEFEAVPQPGGLGSTVAFTLSYRGTNPQTVARVANALASFYLDQDVKIRERQTSRAVELLEAQLEDVKSDLMQQERTLAEFQDQHMGELPQHADANLAALRGLYEELGTTGEQKARALERRDELMGRLEAHTDAPRVSADLAAERLARLKEELGGLTQRYSDKYPEVIRLKSEVATLEQQVAARRPAPAAEDPASRGVRRLKQSLAEVEAEIDNLKTDEARLRAQIAGYVQRLENAPQRQRAFQEISRDHQTTRDLYDSLRKRYEQAQLEQGAADGQAAPRFRILDPALPPTTPIAPNRLVLLFLAVIGSLIVAAGAAFLAERLDTSFHAADDVRSFTRVPVVASIPLIVTAGDHRIGRRRFWLVAVSVLLAIGLVVPTFHRFARSQETLASTLARP